MYRCCQVGKSLVVHGLLLGSASQLASLVALHPPPGIELIGQSTGIAVPVLFYAVVAMRRPRSPAEPSGSGVGAVPSLS